MNAFPRPDVTRCLGLTFLGIAAASVAQAADLAILTGDYLGHPEGKRRELHVAVTVVGGEVVHESAAPR